MTYRDNDRIRNPDDPWHREWGIGSIIASLVAIVIMAGILAYGATQATDMPTRSSTISQPTAQGSAGRDPWLVFDVFLMINTGRHWRNFYS